MQQISERDSLCFRKAIANGEGTFTLRDQDLSSPRTICFWIMENIETCPSEKLHQALDDAIRARNWPKRKSAD